MNNIYIEDKNGNKYTFKKLTRNQTMEVISKFNNEDSTMVKLEKQFKEIFMICNPNYNQDLIEEEILQYNYEELGFGNYTKLLSLVIEKVFHTTGTNQNKYSFLED